MAKKKDGDLAYYLTLFKLKGHTTWRAHLCSYKGGFEEEQKRNWGKGPEVTEKQTLRIDRLSGAFSS